jgi:hypothetical protein
VTILIGLLSATFGAAVGAIATYLTTRSTMRLGLEHDYDKTLRDIRIKGHQQLFHLSRQIPRHWLLTPQPTRAQLVAIRTAFHDWYYHPEAHGMFLARHSKKAYIQLMNALDAALFETAPGGNTKLQDRPDSPLTAQESHRLLELASALRHQLAADIGASNPPRTRSEPPEPTVASFVVEDVAPDNQ